MADIDKVDPDEEELPDDELDSDALDEVSGGFHEEHPEFHKA